MITFDSAETVKMGDKTIEIVPAIEFIKVSVAFSLDFIISSFDIPLGFIGIARVFPLGFIKNNYICHWNRKTVRVCT